MGCSPNVNQSSRDVFSPTLLQSFQVVGHCILSWQYVGFNIFDVGVSKNLPKTPSLFTSALLKHIPSSIKDIYIRELTLLLSTEGYDRNRYLPIIFSGTSVREDNSLLLIQIISGYSLLWRSGLLKRIIGTAKQMDIHLALAQSIQENLRPFACGLSVIPLQKKLAVEGAVVL